MSAPATIDIDMTLITAWLKLSSMQGFQRAYRVNVLGKYLGDITTVPITYNQTSFGDLTDYNIFYSTDTVATASVGDRATLGGSTVGDTNVYTIMSVGTDVATGYVYYVLDKNYEYVIAGSILTVYPSVGAIGLQVGFNYDETFPETTSFSVVPVTTTEPVKFQHHIKRQKCDAVRFKLTWTSAIGPLRFTGLTLQLGGKHGIFKLDSSKRV